MKWFEHQTNAKDNKKIRKIEIYYKPLGGQAVMAAVGRFWRLYEIVGSQGLGNDGLDTFALPDDYDLNILADDLWCTVEELQEFLGVLAQVNSIDPAAWEEQKIYCPKLGERADSYTKKRERMRPQTKKYGQCANSIRTVCEQYTDKVRQSPRMFSPQTQTQTQTQKDVCGAPGGNGRGKAAHTQIFESENFQIDGQEFEALCQVNRELSRERVLAEIGKASDHAKAHPKRHKRGADGRMIKARPFLRDWLERAEVSAPVREPPAAAVPQCQRPAPVIITPENVKEFADPNCGKCVEGMLTINQDGHEFKRKCNCVKEPKRSTG